MQRTLARLAPYTYAVLRIVAGLLFAVHGAQKLFGMFGGRRMDPMSMMGLAGGIELIGGLMIALGLFTSLAALIASGEMAYAYFTVHAPQGPIPNLNNGELAALYCVIFLYIASRGTVALGVHK